MGKLHQLSKADVDEFLQHFTAFFDGNILNSGFFFWVFFFGYQFKVGIAACLLQKPEVLILDEPFANLDPSSQMRLIRMLKELPSQQKVTVLISSHDLNHVTDVCNRILLMEKGRIIKDIDTTADTLQELELYLEV